MDQFEQVEHGLLAEEGHIYGVTTGYGDSVTRRVPAALVAELPLHLTRFHGCGLGADLLAGGEPDHYRFRIPMLSYFLSLFF